MVISHFSIWLMFYFLKIGLAKIVEALLESYDILSHIQSQK